MSRVVLKNNTDGRLTIVLEDSTGIRVPRMFRMRRKGDTVIIPDIFVESMTYLEPIQNARKKGMFLIQEGEENLQGALKEVDTTKILTDAKMRVILTSGNQTEVADLMNDPINSDRAWDLSIALNDTGALSNATITTIEEVKELALAEE